VLILLQTPVISIGDPQGAADHRLRTAAIDGSLACIYAAPKSDKKWMWLL